MNRLAAQVRARNTAIIEAPLDRAENVRKLVLQNPDGHRAIPSGGPAEVRRFPELFPTPSKTPHETD